MSVTARRLPASRPGKGTAIRYVSGNMPIMGKQGTRHDLKRGTKSADAVAPISAAIPSTGTEEDKISAMFQAQGEQWEQTQEHMANATPVYFKNNHTPQAPDHPPPPGYVCYRCGQKGHWIQACPTNNDPTWEGKRVRRTTGIPRSFLKTVAKPADEDSGTYMINGDGEFVVAMADESSWKNFQSKAKARKEQTDKPDDPELEDPITHRLFVKPVKTPCCKTTYSEEGIQQALLDSDFVCPKCGTEEILLDSLTPDTDMEEKVAAYKADKGLNSPKPDNAETAEGGKRKREDDEEVSDSAEGQTKKLKDDDNNEPKEGSRSPGSDSSKVDGELSTKSLQDASNVNMPPMPMMPGMPAMPMMPGMLPFMQSMPGMPGMPPMPTMPTMPTMPGMPVMPMMPGMPSFMPGMMGMNNNFNNGFSNGGYNNGYSNNNNGNNGYNNNYNNNNNNNINNNNNNGYNNNFNNQRGYKKYQNRNRSTDFHVL